MCQREKYCKGCQRFKPLDEFSGKHTKCNACRVRNAQKNNEATRSRAFNFRRTWTLRDDEMLSLNQHLTNKKLAQELGRTLRAIDQRKCLLGIRKGAPPAKKPITEFFWYSDTTITQITIIIFEYRLTVYSHPTAAIREAFVRDGLSKDLYEQWLHERTLL